MTDLSCRGLLAAGPLLLAVFRREHGRYFGNTMLPRSRTLTHRLPVEPQILGPAPYTDVWTYLKKPFVRGLGTNSVDRHQFKYAWIDCSWSKT